MRSPVAHRPAQAIDPETPEPRRVVPAAPLPSRAAVLGAHEDGQGLVDIAVDGLELPPGVAGAEVGAPRSKDAAQVAGSIPVPSGPRRSCKPNPPASGARRGSRGAGRSGG